MKEKVKNALSGTKARKRTSEPKPERKAPGDVIGLSRARVPDAVPRATSDRGGRPKGIEVGDKPRKSVLRPSRTVGGVRGRGR